LGEEGVEELLAQTINVALELKLISRGIASAYCVKDQK
jgi:hypothetical protein